MHANSSRGCGPATPRDRGALLLHQLEEVVLERDRLDDVLRAVETGTSINSGCAEGLIPASADAAEE
jgi:hypothetical protein